MLLLHRIIFRDVNNEVHVLIDIKIDTQTRTSVTEKKVRKTNVLNSEKVV